MFCFDSFLHFCCVQAQAKPPVPNRSVSVPALNGATNQQQQQQKQQQQMKKQNSIIPEVLLQAVVSSEDYAKIKNQ